MTESRGEKAQRGGRLDQLRDGKAMRAVRLGLLETFRLNVISSSSISGEKHPNENCGI
jgi:hypothetical protein